MNQDTFSCYATTSAGIEKMLAAELGDLGAGEPVILSSGVQFTADLRSLYTICLWSRLANRVLVQLFETAVTDRETLYRGCSACSWEKHMTWQNTFSVSATSRDSNFRDSSFAARVVKDGIADRFRTVSGRRPSVNAQRPDLAFHAHIEKSLCTLYLDFSGGSLHQRGYRKSRAEAPLKEHVAAAILTAAEWPRLMKQGYALVDPMCGTGTFTIEGAMMSLSIPPGKHKRHFGFEKWSGHDAAMWKRVKSENSGSSLRAEPAGTAPGIQIIRKSSKMIFGFDTDASLINGARHNARQAGVQDSILYEGWGLHKLPDLSFPEQGLVVINPPYGIRLGEERYLPALYQLIGRVLKQKFDGWEAAVLVPDSEAGKLIGLRARKVLSINNGELPCKLLLLSLNEENSFRIHLPAYSGVKPTIMERDNSEFLINRLKKNQKALSVYLGKDRVSCFRLYDADIPEYSAAVDLYDGQWIHIQEYAPPSSVPESKSLARLLELITSVSDMTEIPKERIFVKQRTRHKRREQYSRIGETGMEVPVREGGHTFLVNFSDYLDTGLYLDGRHIREKIGTSAPRRFCNLFCYTGSASVYASAAGAEETVSVDTNATYLDWAKRNMEANRLSLGNNHFIESDIFDWLREDKSDFDLIYIDPPTFSNSKERRSDFDIHRDHTPLIHLAARHLSPEGSILFSSHTKGFTLDEDLYKEYRITEITDKIMPPDFSRTRARLVCYEISQGQ